MLDKIKDKIRANVWRKVTFKTFLIVAVFTLIAEFFLLYENSKYGFFHIIPLEFLVVFILGGSFIISELFLALLLLKCFEDILYHVLEDGLSIWKGFLLGCFISLIVYSSIGLGGRLLIDVDGYNSCIFIELTSFLFGIHNYFLGGICFFLLRIVAFIFIYAFLVCNMAEKFRVKAPKSKKKKSV